VVGRAADAAFALFRMRTARKRAQPTKKGGKDKRYNNDYNNLQYVLLLKCDLSTFHY